MENKDTSQRRIRGKTVYPDGTTVTTLPENYDGETHIAHSPRDKKGLAKNLAVSALGLGAVLALCGILWLDTKGEREAYQETGRFVDLTIPENNGYVEQVSKGIRAQFHGGGYDAVARAYQKADQDAAELPYQSISRAMQKIPGNPPTTQLNPGQTVRAIDYGKPGINPQE